MKVNEMAAYAFLFAMLVAVLSISSVQGKDLTQSDYEEYISNFIGAASYQLPEPVSTLSSLIMSSPDLTKGALKNWAYNNMLSTTRNLMDADQSGNKEQIDHYNDQLDRWQAVYSCLNGDCTHMQQLEGSAGTGQAGGQQEAAAPATAAGGLVADKTRYQKGALLIGPISIPAEWTEPQDIIFLDQGRPYIVVGEGTCSLWDSPPEPDGVDCCFVYAKWRIGDVPQVWGQLELVDPSIHLSELIERNTGKPAEYNSSHVYEAVAFGEGKMLKARVYDGGGYSDNHGELKISVYQAI
ncbi:MAG: hypothetical protein A4E49_03194 [Methanosaeta sp. PtaU1.Bin112]|nr:MAG: hypothetical protein A4E49_03194 [Methanosaeta sp. PtaU1.Bin112]